MKNEDTQAAKKETLKKGMDDFNFELWAKQVRPQLLASLQKRGVR